MATPMAVSRGLQDTLDAAERAMAVARRCPVMSVDNTPEWYTKARKSQHPTPERNAAGGRDEEIESA